MKPNWSRVCFGPPQIVWFRFITRHWFVTYRFDMFFCAWYKLDHLAFWLAIKLPESHFFVTVVGQGNAIPVVSYSTWVHLFLSIYELSSKAPMGWVLEGRGGGGRCGCWGNSIWVASQCVQIFFLLTLLFKFFFFTEQGVKQIWRKN